MSAFSNKTILITGAAGGIGQELARTFATRGGRIAVLDKNDSILEFAGTLTSEGFEAAAAVADIGSFDEVAAAFEQLRGQLGPIDILINNAGFANANNLEELTLETWHAEINGNLNGAYHCTRLALPDMKNAGGGAIVNIGSVNGLTSLGNPAYSAAKAGLISFTKAVAMEYGRFAIRANVICPGTVETPIWSDRVKRNPEIFNELIKWYPLRRVAYPVDIAKAAAFLASEDASAITGAMLPVDCGLMAGNIVMSREITMSEF